MTQFNLHDRLRIFLETRGITEVHTWLGMFGALTAKPVKLFSNASSIAKLKRTLFGYWDSVVCCVRRNVFLLLCMERSNNQKCS